MYTTGEGEVDGDGRGDAGVDGVTGVAAGTVGELTGVTGLAEEGTVPGEGEAAVGDGEAPADRCYC